MINRLGKQPLYMQIDELTPAMQRVLSIAEIQASKTKSVVGTNHVLLAMMLEGENPASFMLSEAGFTVEEGTLRIKGRTMLG